jgi:pimeloyl-ACP methyl ester carboxylesterase
VSTPTSLVLPDGVRRTEIRTSRGSFAALEALPVPGVCERDTALLVPGYTGSKEDFLALLDQLAAAGRQVFAIDMRGQYQTPGGTGLNIASQYAADLDGGGVGGNGRNGAGHNRAGQDSSSAHGAGTNGAGTNGAGTNGAGTNGAGQNGASPYSTGQNGASLDGTTPDRYSAKALGADIAAIARATGARHLLGHSYGGLVVREAMLDYLTGDGIESFALMSSGPAALTGPRAHELRAMLAALGAQDGKRVPDVLPVAELWHSYLEPQAVAAGVPAEIVAFLRERMLGNDPTALVRMARHLLTAPDRTEELARLRDIPMLVLYGENDNSWSPVTQENMARRLRARRICIPGALHSPNVEAPATTASALTAFWDAAEAPVSVSR